MNKQSRTNSGSFTRKRMRQSGGTYCCHEKSSCTHDRAVTWRL